MEQRGSISKDYRYNDILSELSSKGFVVIGETKNFAIFYKYADKVVSQFNRILFAGVILKNRTSASHSKDGLIYKVDIRNFTKHIKIGLKFL